MSGPEHFHGLAAHGLKSPFGTFPLNTILTGQLTTNSTCPIRHIMSQNTGSPNFQDHELKKHEQIVAHIPKPDGTSYQLHYQRSEHQQASVGVSLSQRFSQSARQVTSPCMQADLYCSSYTSDAGASKPCSLVPESERRMAISNTCGMHQPFAVCRLLSMRRILLHLQKVDCHWALVVLVDLFLACLEDVSASVRI